MKTTQQYVDSLSFEAAKAALMTTLQALESIAVYSGRGSRRAECAATLYTLGWVGNGYVKTVRLGDLKTGTRFRVTHTAGVGAEFMVVGSWMPSSPKPTLDAVNLADGMLYTFGNDTRVVTE